MIMNLLDAASVFLDGKNFIGNIHISYIINIAGFSCQLIMIILWVDYAWREIFDQSMDKKKKLYLLHIPAFLIVILNITTIFNVLVFSIDDFNHYHRNTCAYIPTSYTIIWGGIIAVNIFKQARKELVYEQRKSLYILSVFH